MKIRRLGYLFWGTLRRRLIFSVSIIQAILMTMFIFDSTYRQIGILRDLRHQEAVALASSLAEPAAGWLSSHDLVGLQEIIKAQTGRPELAFAMYLDSQGRVMAHTDAQRIGQYLVDLPANNQTGFLREDDDFLDLATPVKIQDNLVGWVRVGLDQTLLKAQVRSALWNAVIYALVAIALVSAVALLLGTFFLRRLNHIQTVIVGIRSGHGRRRTHLTGNDEAARLGREFNHMIATLELRDAEIKASEARWRAIIEQSRDGIILTDSQGRIAILNAAAEAISGWSIADAAGRPYAEILQLSGENQAVEDGLQPVSLLTRQGGRVWVETSTSPIRDKDGFLLGMVILFRDITERLHLEAAEKQAEKLESIGTLAGGIAHDFNNLLAGLFGYMELAQGEVQPGSRAQAYLSKAQLVYDRARELTLQLLTFSKGGNPQLQIGLLAPVVEQTVRRLLAVAPVAADITIEPNLPNVAFDPKQVEQVVTHIVQNALQAMPGGGQLTVVLRPCRTEPVAVTADEECQFLEVSFRDNGHGIPESIRNRIFDPFFTTDDRRNGLGLTTCYSIMKKHSGAIDLESEVGRGTKVRLLFPISLSQPVPQTQAAPLPVVSGDGLVMIMDDEDFLRDIMRKMLEPAGFQVMEAREGQSAVAQLKDCWKQGRPVRAAIFDLTVQEGMGGVAALAEVRRFWPDLPVFASSGFSKDPVMANPQAFGFNGCLPKPYLRADLLRLLG